MVYNQIVMKEIWKYLKKNKEETILAPLFKMLEACFELFIPLIVADIIDIGIANKDTGYIIHRGILMIFFGAVGFLLAVIAQYFSAKSAVGVSSALRKELFYHISGLNYERLDRVGTSALITSMTSDINQVQNGVNWVLRLLLRSPFIVIGAAIMSCTINLRASLIFWITIAALILVIFLIIKITTPMNADVQFKLEKVTRSFRENLLGVRVIRAFNRQTSEKKQFDERHEKLYESQIKAGKVSSLLNPLTFAIINLAIVLILYSGAVNVSIGDMQQGEVIALYNYMSQILVELIKFANVILVLSKAIACFKRIQNVLKTKPSLANGSEAFVNSDAIDIKLNNVSFSYNDGGNPAIEKITCHIPAGSKVGIIGATASGKTTLINLIARYYERTGGEILLNDIPIESYDIRSLTDNIAVVPQKAVLFKGTVRSNLKWGDKNASDEECWSALANSGAIDFIKAKGLGLDLPVSQNGRNFSGGQKQRLAIARALIKKSGILILDDSYSALDYATESHVKNSVFANKENCTVLTVSQRVSSIYNSDFILVMDKGRLVAVGTHGELFDSCPVYNEICRSQQFGEEAAV
jgi:ATP-binding cassette subfamily B multidrug efflux pump